MTAYYNEIEPYAAQWLRNLIAAGHIAPGDVDARSIEEVTPDDIKGYAQVHMFAGLGAWSYALRRAGWADDRPVWTGSCPCQPFSSAGQRKGFDDARHLWPHAFRLISQCRPGVVFGEQVSGKNGFAWLDLVQDQLEGCGYAVGALGVSAAGVGAPHIRRRLYFVADAEWDGNRGCGPGAVTGAATGVQGEDGQWERVRPDSGAGCATGVDAGSDTHTDGCIWPGVSGEPREAHASIAGASSPVDARLDPDEQRRKGRCLQPGERACQCPAGQTGEVAGHRTDAQGEQVGPAGQSRGEDAVANSTSERRYGSSHTSGQAGRPSVEDGSPLRGFWADAEWLPTVDGRYMPTQPGIFPLALSYPGRMEQLRAYGNSLCAETAIEFIRAYMECRP